MLAGSKVPDASSHAATSPRRVAKAANDAAMEVLPEPARPVISLIRPRGIPPSISASSGASPELSRRSLRVSSWPRKTPAKSNSCGFSTEICDDGLTAGIGLEGSLHEGFGSAATKYVFALSSPYVNHATVPSRRGLRRSGRDRIDGLCSWSETFLRMRLSGCWLRRGSSTNSTAGSAGRAAACPVS